MALPRSRFLLLPLLGLLAFAHLDDGHAEQPDLPRPAPPGDIGEDDDDDDDELREGPEHEGEEEAEEIHARNSWLQRRLGYPTGRIPVGARSRALKGFAGIRRADVRASNRLTPLAPKPPEPPGAPEPAKAVWSFLGPAPLDTSKGAYVTPNMSPSAGRASAIAIDPTDANIVYAGYAMGGAWKSTDGGKSWKAITDTLSTLAVGAIAIDPASPKTIWLGTGEPALYAGYGGEGLFKSTDGGETWEKTSSDQFDGLAISRVVLDGGDVYVTTTFGSAGRGSACTNSYFDADGQGLYKSTDGGKTFELLKKGSMVDLEIDTSATPRRLFVSDFDAGAFRSIDGGETWSAPEGLPTLKQGATRIEIALAPSDPDRVYAGLGHGNHATVFMSTDGGASFSELPGAPNYCETQCHYDNSVIVDPSDADTVWVGGGICGVWKTANASAPEASWANVSLPDKSCGNGASKWALGYVHPDIHALAIDPKEPGVVYVASDGGLARTPDGGETWARLNAGVGTMQFYGICLDPSDPDVLYGGAQDNGSMQRNGDKLTWRGLLSGDGGPCAVDPANPKTVLISAQEASVYRSTNGFTSGGPSPVFSGETNGREPFIAPIAAGPGAFYVGTYRLWRNTEGGTKKGWSAISDDLTAGNGSVSCAGDGFGKADDVLSAIAVAPGAPDTIYTGSEGGVLSVTTDGGQQWTKVSKAPLPKRYLSSIAVDPVDSKRVYAAFSGFDANTPETPGHVFTSDDGGASWRVLDIGLDVPVNTLVAHPVASGLVYAGTDLGVLVTTDGGASWSVLGDDLPRAAVYSLQFHRSAQRLVAGTFGRSAWFTAFGPGALTASPTTLAFSTTLKQGNPVGEALKVGNVDIYGSVVEFTAAADAPWLTLSATSGAAAGANGVELIVGANVDGLAVGEYDGKVSVTPNGGGEAIVVPVHLSVKQPVKPAPPKDDESGCGCRVAGGESWSGVGVAALGLAVVVAARRRSTRPSRRGW